jgi:cytochrome c553
MNKTIVALMCAAGLAAAPALAADSEAGKQKAEVCKACHGEGGAKPLTPQTPVLAGQYEDYLVHSMQAFKRGDRQNPMMNAMVQPLSDQDIANLAAYFAQQTGLQVKY